jgi:single-strand DNA-binding protein
MDFAQLTYQGRLTDDPELRETKSGTPVCKFTVACNRRVGKDEERTSFIPTTVFGGNAAICAEYLSKGREVHVTGHFETDTYTDKKGITRKGFNCIARAVDFGRGGKRQEEAAKEEEFDNLDAETKAKAVAYLRRETGPKGYRHKT